ncbi:hypothetical protein [Cellvibrio sp. BR]|uniref:hypothetical protein n=1 Tax=Cellvibrio sp. BR TaxID=1134474 RepID=UPI00058AC6FD|nr:hypothetical protein [Cellvibrio sp. BR]
MQRAGAVCPECGSTKTPRKEKIMGQDTQDLICADCRHVGWWASFQPKNQKEKEVNKGES